MLSRAAIAEIYRIFTHTADANQALGESVGVWLSRMDGLDVPEQLKKEGKMRAYALDEPHARFGEFVGSVAQLATTVRKAGTAAPGSVPPVPNVLQNETPRERVVRMLDLEGQTARAVVSELEQHGIDTGIVLRVRSRLLREMTNQGGLKTADDLVDELLKSGRVDIRDLWKCIDWLECSNAFLDFSEIAQTLKAQCDAWVKDRQDSKPAPVIDSRLIAGLEVERFFLDLLRVLSPAELQAIEMYPGLENALILWLHTDGEEGIPKIQQRLARLKQSGALAELWRRYTEEGKTVVDRLPWTPEEKNAAYAFCRVAAQLERWKNDVMPRAEQLAELESRERLSRRIEKNPDDVELRLKRAALLSLTPGQGDAGLSDLNHAIALRPSAAGYLGRGTLYAITGKMPQAEADFTRGLELSHSESDETVAKIYAMRAGVRQDQGRLWAALADMQLARILVRGDVPLQAIEKAESAAWLARLKVRRTGTFGKTESPELFDALACGREALRAGDYADALASFKGALELDAANALALEGRELATQQLQFMRQRQGTKFAERLAQRRNLFGLSKVNAQR